MVILFATFHDMYSLALFVGFLLFCVFFVYGGL